MSYPPVLILIIEGVGGGGGGGGGGLGEHRTFCPMVRCLMKSSTSYRNVHSDNVKMENENKGLRKK